MSPVLTLDQESLALRQRADAALRLARCLGRPAFLSHVERLPFRPDPLAFLGVGSAELGSGVLWWQPDAAAIFAGAGSAVALTASGAGRFRDVADEMRELRARLVPSGTLAALPVIGGFSFTAGAPHGWPWQGFPDAMLRIPAVLLQSVANQSLLRVTVSVTPRANPAEVADEVNRLLGLGGSWSETSVPLAPQAAPASCASAPPRAEWEDSVAAAVSLIRGGAIDKVVLAREEQLRFSHALDPIATLARLRAADVGATLFAMASRDSWFFGATPERLVRLQDGQVDVTCLAGSVAAGESDVEQAELARQLLESAKEREEHEIVVHSTMSALADACQDVRRAAGTPRVVTARSVQHLQTPVTARMAPGGHILDLVDRLHPTPAVGGFPRDAAIHVMHGLERFDRGWYAAPFGWTDLNGSGEFAVAIRSALIRGHDASLFAGCGIVAGSEPAREFVETEMKLKPMLAALAAW